MTRSQVDAALKAIYDRIPEIPDCDGRCWTSCGAIDMSDRERQRIRQAGYRITPVNLARAMEETFYCEALTSDRRCAVYTMRPLVCRLWGAAEGLRCPYGCVPAGGYLKDDDAYRMIVEAARVGGHAVMLPDTPALRAVMQSEYFQTTMKDWLQVGNATEQRRIEGNIPAAFQRKGKRLCAVRRMWKGIVTTTCIRSRISWRPATIPAAGASTASRASDSPTAKTCYANGAGEPTTTAHAWIWRETATAATCPRPN